MKMMRLSLLVLALLLNQIRAEEQPEPFTYDAEGEPENDAFRHAVASFRKTEQNERYQVETTYLLGGSPNVAYITYLGIDRSVKSYNDIYNWAVQGGGDRKPLSEDEMKKVEALLQGLPPSVPNVPRPLLMLIAFNEDGKRVVRSYDRGNPPQALIDLYKLLEARFDYGPIVRGDAPQEYETPSPGEKDRMYCEFRDATMDEIRDKFDWLKRSVLIDPKLLENAPKKITLREGESTYIDSLHKIAKHLGGTVLYSNGVYCLYKDPLLDIQVAPPQPVVLADAAALTAFKELEHEDSERREAAARTLISAGTAIRPKVQVAKKSNPNDVNLQATLTRIENAIQTNLRDREIGPSLKMQLHSNAQVWKIPNNLKGAVEAMRAHFFYKVEIVVPDGLADRKVSFNSPCEISVQAALETMARMAGCKLEITRRRIAFVP